MFKTKLLTYKTKSIAQNNSSKRSTKNYDQAKNLGIIFSIGDKSRHEMVKQFIKKLELDGKEVSVLSYLPKNFSNHEFKFDFFTKKDLSFWGNYTSQEVIGFANQPFDYLLYLDAEPNPIIEGILAMSKAKCRVGRFRKNNCGFFEFMVNSKLEHGQKSLLDEMYQYIKILG